MKSNFLEYAIHSDEVGDYFRGNGKYFVPSQDYDGHVHGAHMGGDARVFAEASLSNSIAFDESFLTFLNTLLVSKEDVSHLLANLSSYFAQKSRGGFSNSKLFENLSSPGSVLLKEYISKVKESAIIFEVKEQILRHAQFIKLKGSGLLENIVGEI